jgi:hypothetical protein
VALGLAARPVGAFSLGARFEIIVPGAKIVEKPSGCGGVLMLIPDESDAVKKAWTYAVLDAIKAADENTRLEIARILCPAGFEIVEIEATKAAAKH